MITVTFGEPQKTGPRGYDGHQHTYPFSTKRLPPGSKLDVVTQHRITVAADRSLVTPWHLPEGSVPRALFAFALAVVKKRLETGTLRIHETVSLSTQNSRPDYPYDLGDVPEPSGHTFQLDTPKRTGF